MALVLTLREGHDFYVGHNRVVVQKPISAMEFPLLLHDGSQVMVNGDGWTEIEKGVRVQAGIPRDLLGSIVRLIIDAPGVKILRGDLYHDRRKTAPAPKPKYQTKDVCTTCKGRRYLVADSICPICKGHGCSNCNKGKVTHKFACPDCLED